MTTTFVAAKLVTGFDEIVNPVITIEEGRIVALASQEEVEANQVTFDFSEYVLTSGLLDIHFHGAMGHDVMEGTPSALRTVSAYLARSGVTEYLATTVTASLETTLRALDGIANFIEANPDLCEARTVGIHIEGPFLSPHKRGMHPAQFLLSPSPDLLDRFWEASRGQIRLMTIAPEVPGALDTIKRATQLGIRSSLGHTNATQAEAAAGIHAGATTATHTFNAMRPFDHREPGVLGVVLDREDLFADLICDGLHVAPEAVRLWLKAKGPRKSILITDCLEAAGMPDGTYKLGETRVHLHGRTCTTDEGVLAGSVITLDQAVANLRRFTGTDLATAVRMASSNPARMLGLAETCVPGAAANFNVFDGEGALVTTIVRGNLLR